MANPYAKNLKKTVFDIETTGLAPGRDMIINAGFCDPDTGRLFQLFAENENDEERLLKELFYIISQHEVVITYNGDRFDLPFIKTRAEKFGIDADAFFWSIDMYRYLKSYWLMAGKMRHLDQKSVEIALGLSDDRADRIGGGECIPLYRHYLSQQDAKSKDLILLHNADDVRQLARIYNAAVFLPYDRICSERGFGILAPRYVLCRSVRLDNNALYAEAKTLPGGIPSSIYEDSYELEYDCFSGDIRLKIMLAAKETLRYVDLNSLPCEKDALSELKGYHSDFLVLADGQRLLYQEINMLLSGILSGAGLF